MKKPSYANSTVSAALSASLDRIKEQLFFSYCNKAIHAFLQEIYGKPKLE